jgi:uncharacterized lipoprotein YmbA
MRIVIAIRLLASLAAAGLAAGCASPPMKYYTLSPAQWVATGSSQRTLQAVVAVRSVPAGLDTAALVVRRGDTQVELAEGARWTAPFADEVREAFKRGVAAGVWHCCCGHLAVSCATAATRRRKRAEV